MIATTATGILKDIPDCYIQVGNLPRIYMYVMPDIGDGHNATYQAQTGIGRSLPSYTFSFGDKRSISWAIHLYADSQERLVYNLKVLRTLEAATYPRTASDNQIPFVPPWICKLKCGEVLGSIDYETQAVLTSYNVKFPVDVQWAEPFSANGINYGAIPYKFDIDCQFEVVYAAGSLPGAERIIKYGN
jgi:hypothetical protein